MVLLPIIGILLLLGTLPIGIYVAFRDSKISLYVSVGLIRLPINKENRTRKKKVNKKPKDTEFASRVSVKKKQSRGLKAYVPLLKPVFNFLVDFRTKLRVKELKVNVVLAGGDPCDLSVNYGRAWAAVGNLMPHLERFFLIKKRDIKIECDFTGEKTIVDASVYLTMSVGRILQIVFYHGVLIIREYFKILKNAKDGAIS